MKKILLIAPNIPVYDTNAGDYRIFQILKFLSGRYEVSFFPLNEKPGLSRYARNLKDMGIKLIDRPPAAGEYNTVIFEHYESAEIYSRMFGEIPGCRRVIDSHCLKFRENERSLSIGKISFRGSKSRELEIYGSAGLVITVTEKEKMILKECGVKTDIETVPTGIRIGERRKRKGRKNVVFTGCMSNLHNEDAAGYFAEEIFPRITGAFPETKFYIVGSYPSERIKKLQNSNVVVTGYVPDTEVYAGSSLVAVAPLRTGAGMKQKILEYASYGCPVVSTSVGCEGMQLDGVITADAPEEFAEAVCGLMTDEAEWEHSSSRAHRSLKQNYSLEAMERRMLEVV